jgi:hypothetical protein
MYSLNIYLYIKYCGIFIEEGFWKDMWQLVAHAVLLLQDLVITGLQ